MAIINMTMTDAVLYLLGIVLLNKLYWYLSDRRLAKRTGGALPNIRPEWYDFFGLVSLYRIIQLSWTLRNYEHLSELVERNGTTMVGDMLGKRTVITVDPGNIKAILATQFDHYGKGSEFITAWRQFLGAGIFNADGQVWKHSRALLRPQFLKSRIADLEIMQAHTDVLIDQIIPGSDTDFTLLAFRMTLDTATDFLFGDSTNTLEKKSDSGFAKTFAKIQELQMKRMTSGPLWRFVSLEHHVKDLDKFVDYYVQETLSKPTIDDKFDAESASFLDILARDTRDPEVLRDQLVSTLLAGRDTTAATLSWILKHLANDAERFARLRAEVLDVLGPDGRATYSQLKSMAYLNACIDETLRLYPIVPMNVRQALCDTTLPTGGGPDGTQKLAVRTGTQVWYIPLVMQRMQDIPDVTQWKPERWLSWTPKPWTYIPFNGGARVCLGQNFAIVEMSVVLAQLAQKFTRLETADDLENDFSMRYDIILTPRHGTRVRFYTD